MSHKTFGLEARVLCPTWYFLFVFSAALGSIVHLESIPRLYMCMEGSVEESEKLNSNICMACVAHSAPLAGF